MSVCLRANGGAVYGFHESKVTIRGERWFANNEAGIKGGAIYIWNPRTLNVENSMFEAEEAGSEVGAICVEPYSVVTVKRTMFYQNKTLDDNGGVVRVNR